MIATASFTIPYPKIIENSWGYWLDFIRVRAATESVADMVALYFTMSPVYKVVIWWCFSRMATIQLS